MILPKSLGEQLCPLHRAGQVKANVKSCLMESHMVHYPFWIRMYLILFQTDSLKSKIKD